MIDTSFKEVLAAAREVVADRDEWPMVSWAAGEAIGRHMKLDLHSRDFREQAAIDRFHGQAGRAINKLADEGVLRKAGKGTRGPRGFILGNEAEFWSPAAWDAAVAQAARDQEAAEALAVRWAAVFVQLHAAGFKIEQVGSWRSETRGGPLTTDIDGWERLLEAFFLFHPDLRPK